MSPILTGLAVGASLLLGGAAFAADAPFADVEVETENLRGGVHMITGAGGNIGVLATRDGLLMVDDQYAPLAERLQTELDAIAADGPRFVVNTHFHGDHTGSNPFFGREGTIIAHENVRVRLLEGDEMPAAGLPVITYDDRIRLHMSDETIDLVHLPNGHTDGDSVVFFREADVVHLGDHFFNGRFPFVDRSAGGSVDGLIANVADLLEQLGPDTVIIPGHGPLADTDDLRSYLEMLRTTRQIVGDQVTAGRSDEEILARGLAERWEDWGWEFITEERWLSTLLAEARNLQGD